MVTSVERGGAVDVSSDEGGLLFPNSVVPHPSDATLYTEEKRTEGGWKAKVEAVMTGKDNEREEYKWEKQDDKKEEFWERK